MILTLYNIFRNPSWPYISSFYQDASDSSLWFPATSSQLCLTHVYLLSFPLQCACFRFYAISVSNVFVLSLCLSLALLMLYFIPILSWKQLSLPGCRVVSCDSDNPSLNTQLDSAYQNLGALNTCQVFWNKMKQ